MDDIKWFLYSDCSTIVCAYLVDIKAKVERIDWRFVNRIQGEYMLDLAREFRVEHTNLERVAFGGMGKVAYVGYDEKTTVFEKFSKAGVLRIISEFCLRKMREQYCELELGLYCAKDRATITRVKALKDIVSGSIEDMANVKSFVFHYLFSESLEI